MINACVLSNRQRQEQWLPKTQESTESHPVPYQLSFLTLGRLVLQKYCS